MDRLAPQSENMGWIAVTMVLIGLGVGMLVETARRIARTRDEADHYRWSVAFWGTLGGLATVLLALFAMQVWSVRGHQPQLALVSLALVCLPMSAVILTGLRNALVLARAHRRRRGAVAHGDEYAGRVVRRDRPAFTHDLMRLEIEIEVPRTGFDRHFAYRSRQRGQTERRRVIETAPGDKWAEFAPGSVVRVRVAPESPAKFAALLFALSSETRAPARLAGQGSLAHL